MMTMKKTDKFLSSVALAAAVCAVSCSTDDLTAQQPEQAGHNTVSLTATLTEAQTRAGMSKGTADNTASFYWHNKDSILVQTKSSDGSYSSTKFVTTDKTGETTATFWGDALSGATIGQYAVYPYNKKHQFTSATTLTYNLPASYTYTTVDNGIFSKTAGSETIYRTNSTNIPMLGTITDGNVAFQYLGGVAVIRIDKMPFTSGTLTVTADQQLSGNFTVSDLAATAPVIATSSTEAADDKQVTFTFSGATADGVGVFYLPVATGEYTNLTVKISDSNGVNTQTIPNGTLTVSCGNVQAISLTTHNDYLRNFHQISDNRYMVNGHEFVDLGLESGLLWATMNVGATSETDYGSYFAWGETIDDGTWNWDTYKYGTSNNITKYNSTSSETTLAAEDDAATANWGAGIRIPTMTEFAELINTENCSYEISTEAKSYKLTSKKSGHTDCSISLPIAGYGDEQRYLYQGAHGYYWTSTLSTNDITMGCNLYLDGTKGLQCDGNAHSRNCGLSVRAVTTK